MITMPDEFVEIEDSDLKREIETRKYDIERQRKENESFRSKLESV